MNSFTRYFLGTVFGSLLVLPYIGTNRGWTIGGERNLKVIQATQVAVCPDYQKDLYGKCRRSHRSYFRSRNFAGGGGGHGK